MNKKILILALVSVLMVSINISALSIDKTGKINDSSDEYEDYVGYMSISPGTLENTWDDYEIIANINPDFAGEDQLFSIKHNTEITFTADYELKYDSIVLPESWSFTLYIYGYVNDTLIDLKSSRVSFDDFDENDDDDKASGTLSVSIDWDEYDQIVANLTTSYWRVPWSGFNMKFGDTRKTDISVLENRAPNTPTIQGKSQGNTNNDYDFEIFSEDFEEDGISYYIDWGDGYDKHWTNYFESGESFNISHNWPKKGRYDIRVKAKDDFNGKESNWAVMQISIPKPKNTIFNIFEKIFSHFPNISNLF